MSIPLVQNNEKDAINTSIIAIKRQIERINALLGLSNSEEIDTSVFATKEELEDAVTQVETDLAPVDEVTADNMHSVSSNAVANALSYSTTEFKTGGMFDGRPIYKKLIEKTSFQYDTYIGNVLSNARNVLSFNFAVIDQTQDRVYSGNLTSATLSYITEIYYVKSENRIYYKGGNSRGTLFQAYFVFEYTKTTD